MVDTEKLSDDGQGSQGGIMTECGTETANEHVLSNEDAVSFNPLASLFQ